MFQESVRYAVVGSFDRANALAPLLGGVIVYALMRLMGMPLAIPTDIGGGLLLLLATVGSAWLIVVVARLAYWPWQALSAVREAAFDDRDQYENEVVFIKDIIVPGTKLLSGKTFKRCYIKGPAFLKLQSHNSVEFCSVEDESRFHLLTVPEGSPIVGAILLSRDIFKECLFDRNVTFVGTPADTANTSTGLDHQTAATWAARYNTKIS